MFSTTPFWLSTKGGYSVAKNSFQFSDVTSYLESLPGLNIQGFQLADLYSSYIRFVQIQYHVDLLKCTAQNRNVLKVIRSWLNLHTGGQGRYLHMWYQSPTTTNKGLSLIKTLSNFQLHPIMASPYPASIILSYPNTQ